MLNLLEQFQLYTFKFQVGAALQGKKDCSKVISKKLHLATLRNTLLIL
jgi:hypothetical protein